MHLAFMPLYYIEFQLLGRSQKKWVCKLHYMKRKMMWQEYQYVCLETNFRFYLKSLNLVSFCFLCKSYHQYIVSDHIKCE